MNRGADRQDVFVHDRDYQRFEWLLGEATRTTGVEVHAYCLMSNHFHLLMHCREAGLSEAMHTLESRYARWFNDRYERDGPIFRSRFTSILVESDEQLLTVWRYIHRNPLAFLGKEALSAYRWSSLGPYLRRRPKAAWLCVDEVMTAFDGDVGTLRHFVDTDVPSDLVADTRGHRRPLTSERVDEAVAWVAGVDYATILTPRRGATNVPRMLAISLSLELRVAPVTDLAERYGLTPSSLRTTARRGRILVSSDEQIRNLRRRVLEQVWSIP
jgi:REP element-mobilizing transposase RayT